MKKIKLYLWLQVNLVRCLLELPDFSDDVRNLEKEQKQAGKQRLTETRVDTTFVM